MYKVHIRRVHCWLNSLYVHTAHAIYHAVSLYVHTAHAIYRQGYNICLHVHHLRTDKVLLFFSPLFFYSMGMFMEVSHYWHQPVSCWTSRIITHPQQGLIDSFCARNLYSFNGTMLPNSAEERARFPRLFWYQYTSLLVVSMGMFLNSLSLIMNGTPGM